MAVSIPASPVRRWDGLAAFALWRAMLREVKANSHTRWLALAPLEAVKMMQAAVVSASGGEPREKKS